MSRRALLGVYWVLAAGEHVAGFDRNDQIDDALVATFNEDGGGDDVADGDRFDVILGADVARPSKCNARHIFYFNHS